MEDADAPVTIGGRRAGIEMRTVVHREIVVKQEHGLFVESDCCGW